MKKNFERIGFGRIPTNSVAPSSVHKAYTTHNSSICSDEGLTLETSAFQSLYGGQFTFNSVDKADFRVSLPHRRSTTVSSETNPLYGLAVCIWPSDQDDFFSHLALPTYSKTTYDLLLGRIFKLYIN